MYLLSSISARECTKKIGWFVLLWYTGWVPTWCKILLFSFYWFFVIKSLQESVFECSRNSNYMEFGKK